MLEIKVEIKKLDSHGVSPITSDSFQTIIPLLREEVKNKGTCLKNRTIRREWKLLTNSLVQVSVDLDTWVKIRALELLDESVRLFTKQNEIKYGNELRGSWRKVR